MVEQVLFVYLAIHFHPCGKSVLVYLFSTAIDIQFIPTLPQTSNLMPLNKGSAELK